MCKNVDSKGRVTKKKLQFFSVRTCQYVREDSIGMHAKFCGHYKSHSLKKVIKMTYFFLLT